LLDLLLELAAPVADPAREHREDDGVDDPRRDQACSSAIFGNASESPERSNQLMSVVTSSASGICQRLAASGSVAGSRMVIGSGRVSLPVRSLAICQAVLPQAAVVTAMSCCRIAVRWEA